MSLHHQIALTLIPGVGDVNAKKLIAYTGGVEAVFKEKRTALMQIPGIGKFIINKIFTHQHEALMRAEKEIAFIEKHKIQPIFFLDKEYPQRLYHCVDSPIMIYSKGNASMNAERVLAVVGTRAPTRGGIEICQHILRDLRNVQIISGLAYGIDSCAHQTAVDHQQQTVGVLAHGLDRIYPATNRGLATRMLEHGSLITEFLSGSLPDREHFPQRNRIVAGMADAVLVVETAKKGGSLITTELAVSYSRDVFAVPGRPGDLKSEGCNWLIKSNRAALCESAKDIEYVMNWTSEPKEIRAQQKQLFVELNAEEQQIVDVLTKENKNCGLDFICHQAAMPVSRVASCLLNLEFKAVVKSLPGKQYALL